MWLFVNVRERALRLGSASGERTERERRTYGGVAPLDETSHALRTSGGGRAKRRAASFLARKGYPPRREKLSSAYPRLGRTPRCPCSGQPSQGATSALGQIKRAEARARKAARHASEPKLTANETLSKGPPLRGPTSGQSPDSLKRCSRGRSVETPAPRRDPVR